MDNKDQIKGKVKQAVGDLTDDEELKKEGQADERAGDAKEAVEDIKAGADHLVDKVKKELTKRRL